MAPEPPDPPSKRPSLYTDLTSPRSLRQLTLFLAGSTFLALSTTITRRSLMRRYKSTMPLFYQPSHPHPGNKVNGALEAFEALNIATVNVFSFAIMMTGGVLWALDVSTLEDLRRRVRAGMGVSGDGKNADEEMEEWVASVLARKERREEGRRARRDDDGDEGLDVEAKRKGRDS